MQNPGVKAVSDESHDNLARSSSVIPKANGSVGRRLTLRSRLMCANISPRLLVAVSYLPAAGVAVPMLRRRRDTSDRRVLGRIVLALRTDCPSSL